MNVRLNRITPLLSMVLLLVCLGLLSDIRPQIAESARSRRVIQRLTPILKDSSAVRDFELGSAVFMRIFKQEHQLELWIARGDSFGLFKTYKICYFSGEPGPKLRTGDQQSPEGFYYFGPKQLNPWSRFHLSINIGYPNQYDRSHRRTGKYLMIHGDCVSIGCYAMTDPAIEEIYTLSWHALTDGQPFIRVHIFPFRMSEVNLRKHSQSKWIQFWQDLREGYDYFEKQRVPPNITVRNKHYFIESGD